MRGKPFQPVRHYEECRSRIFKKKADEEEKEEQVRKKAREEDLREERQRAGKRMAEGEIDESRGDAAAGETVQEPSSSSRGPGGGESPKRKGGEGGARDIEDLLREAEEEEAGPAGARSMEAEKELGQKMKSDEAASIVKELGALDLIEVFSPERPTKELARFGFRDGAAVGLDEMKPGGEERWDLDREEDYELVREMIRKEEPEEYHQSKAGSRGGAGGRGARESPCEKGDELLQAAGRSRRGVLA